jgi:hypothetical protein
MSRNAALPSTAADPIHLRPWVVVLTGLGMVVIGWIMGDEHIRNLGVTPARVVLLAVGLFTAGAAIGRRLQTAGSALEERLESAGMLCVGAFVAFMAYLASDEWDSVRFFLIGVIIVSLAGGMLILLPVLLRKVLVSLLILFHFVGIFVAGTNVAPQGMDQPPWLTEQLWTRVYRYYLGFLYMTNAYHFYSPNPGPSTLIWFRIQYTDGSYRWVQRPSKKDSLVPLDYTRSMVIADSTNLSAFSPSPWLLARRIEERRYAGFAFVPERGPKYLAVGAAAGGYFPGHRAGEKYRGVQIPITAEEVTQGYGNVAEGYKEPNEYAKRLISSYVRYVAKNYPHSTDPEVAIDHIKVYRFTHRLIAAQEMAIGRDPMQEVYLTPYFMGKFNTDGELINKQQQYDNSGRPIYDPEKCDGFLYWTIPIVAIPKAPQGDIQTPWIAKDFTVRNYMRLHAGDIRYFDDDKKSEAPMPEERPNDEPKKEEGR